MPKNDRLYPISDVGFLMFADGVISQLTNDLKHFKAYDSTFDESLLSRLREAVAAAHAVKSEQDLLAEQQKKKKHVADIMERCNMAVRTLNYFVNRAFAGNTLIRSQFDAEGITKLGGTQNQVLKFMENLSETIARYRVNLLAVGTSEQLLADVAGLTHELKQATIEKENFRFVQSKCMQDRVQRLNEVFRQLDPILTTALQIFTQDSAARKVYTLPEFQNSNSKIAGEK